MRTFVLTKNQRRIIMDKSLKIDKDVRKKLYIKVYYSLLDWEWYDEPNTFRVFMHLLLTANRKDNKIHGKLIRRGESLASLGHIAASTGLSIQNVRTAINNLLSTQEITQRKIGKYCVYTINSYNRLQSDNTISNNNPTRSQQGYNTTATQSQHNANKVPTTPIDCKNDNSDKSVRLTESV